MSRAQATALRELVARLAPVVGVEQWDVRVSDQFTDPGVEAIATMTHWPSQARATLAVAATFFSLSAADQQQTVLHELLHCRVFPLHEQIGAVLATAGLDDDVAALADAMLNVEVERLVDGLADSFSALVPVRRTGSQPRLVSVKTATPAAKRSAKRR